MHFIFIPISISPDMRDGFMQTNLISESLMEAKKAKPLAAAVITGESHVIDGAEAVGADGDRVGDLEAVEEDVGVGEEKDEVIG